MGLTECQCAVKKIPIEVTKGRLTPRIGDPFNSRIFSPMFRSVEKIPDVKRPFRLIPEKKPDNPIHGCLKFPNLERDDIFSPAKILSKSIKRK